MSQKPRDRFLHLKHIGYCWSQLPPKGTDVEFEDFVIYCKFQLSKATHTLMNDPIWDRYEDEQIIAEYYAYIYANSEDERKKLEAILEGYNEDIYSWLDKMISENQKELKELSKKQEDVLEFVPDTIGD